MIVSVLGGVRVNIAFLSLVLYLVCYTVLIGLAEVFYPKFMSSPLGLGTILVCALGILLLPLVAVVTLVVSKFIPHARTVREFAGGAVPWVFVLLEGSDAMWLHASYLGGGYAVWCGIGYLAVAVVTLLLFFWWRPSVRQLRWVVGVAIVGSLLATPGAISWHARKDVLATGSTQDGTVKHVVLITVDTLRKDSLTTYDASGGVTSSMDRIGEAGVVFENAFSSAPWTLPAVSSMMTGLSPSVHQAVRETSVLPDTFQTLAESMGDAGYRTAAIGSNYFLSERTQMDQGFHEYQWSPKPIVKAKVFRAGLAQWLWSLPINFEDTTEELTDRAIDWVGENADDKFFLWLHYFDPHIPYAPPEAFLPSEEVLAGRSKMLWDQQRVRAGLSARDQGERDWIRALYDGEVRYVDANVGRFLDRLEGLGIFDDALIVLTTDHGEEFWEHGGFEHGHALYNELINVPLLVKGPGGRASRREETYVGTQALMTTILEASGVAYDAALGVAPSFATLLEEEAGDYSGPPIMTGALLYYDDQSGVIFDGKKFIRGNLSQQHELFDLEADPGELRSRVESDPANTARGERLLQEDEARAVALRKALGLEAGEMSELDAQELETLKSMGYFLE